MDQLTRASVALPLALSLPRQVSFSDIKNGLYIFLAFLITAKFGQYIFFSYDISPAVLWPPTGIALAAVLLYGYRMWIPITAAALIASYTSPTAPPIFVVFASTLGHTLAPLVGAYLLGRADFHLAFDRSRDALFFMAIVLLTAAITPSLMVIAQLILGNLPPDGVSSWSRSWAGRVLSMLILTPLIVTYLRSRVMARNVREKAIEFSVALLLLLASTYLLFWTSYSQTFVFLFLLIQLSALVWFSTRFNTQELSTALFLLVCLGMAGIIVFPEASATPISNRLFDVELYTILIAPIFLMISSLIQERRSIEVKLEEHIERLEVAMQKLSREDRAKNEFIAILAHELRNPLAPIVSTLELLKLERRMSESLVLIENAEQQAHVMRHLLDDLLDMARVAQKKFKLQKEYVALDAIVSRSVLATEALIQSHSHALAVIVPKKPIMLFVDPVRFEQILVNLLNNAAKYTDPGGRITLKASVHDGITASIEVIDTGIGIAPKDIRHIFEPFRQIKTNARTGTGLGIGLSLTRRLVELHGGTVRVQSDGEGKGSAFTVTVPVMKEQMLPMMHDKEKEVTYVRPGSVLIVDDNAAAAEALGKLLAYKGHAVTFAYTGEAAVLAVRVKTPDAVLLDIGLPDIDGYEVARRLRSGGFAGILIALTGFGQEEDKERARSAGFDHHVVKPVGIAELERLLARASRA